VTPGPIRVSVVCDDCAANGLAHGYERLCDGHGIPGCRAILHPSSLAARLIELGRAADALRRWVDGWNEDPDEMASDGETEEEAFTAALAAVRNHPDFRPDQKEGTNDGL